MKISVPYSTWRCRGSACIRVTLTKRRQWHRQLMIDTPNHSQAQWAIKWSYCSIAATLKTHSGLGIGVWVNLFNKLTIFVTYKLGRGGGTILTTFNWLYINLNKTNIKANNIYPWWKQSPITLRFWLVIVVRLVITLNHTKSHSFIYTFSFQFHSALSTLTITDSLRSGNVSTPSSPAPNWFAQVSWSVIPVGIKTADNIILTLCYLQSRLNILV